MNNIRHLLGSLLAVVLVTLCVSCQYYGPQAIQLGSIPTPATWSEYQLYSAFTLSVPNTMEKSLPNDRYNQMLDSIGLHRNNRIAIFQQKSLNKGTMANADEHYCRVLVNYGKVSPDDDMLHSWETAELEYEARAELFNNVMANLSGSEQLLSAPTYEWVDIGGTKAIRVKYRRSGNNGNTTACAMYYLFNGDEMGIVVTAYREQEARLWQADMENVIRTFRWNRSK